MRGTHTLFLSVHIVFSVLVLHTVPQCAASVSECFPKHGIQEYEHYGYLSRLPVPNYFLKGLCCLALTLTTQKESYAIHFMSENRTHCL